MISESDVFELGSLAKITGLICALSACADNGTTCNCFDRPVNGYTLPSCPQVYTCCIETRTGTGFECGCANVDCAISGEETAVWNCPS